MSEIIQEDTAYSFDPLILSDYPLLGETVSSVSISDGTKEQVVIRK